MISQIKVGKQFGVFVFKVENLQTERLKILHSKCPENKSRLRISNNILVDDKHNFIMCYVTKVNTFGFKDLKNSVRTRCL